MHHDQTISTTEAAAIAYAVLVTLVVLLVISLITYVAMAWLLGRVFRKAHIDRWIAWIPVYNVWKFLELGGQKGFWILLWFLPFVNIIAVVFVCIAAFNISKGFGKEDWFVAVAILLPLVWLAWLAFDESQWHPDKKTVKTVHHRLPRK